MSDQFKDFIVKHRISFIVPSMRLSAQRTGEYLQNFLPDSNLCNDIPEGNSNKIMIIIVTKQCTFEKLHHSIFLENKYERFPDSIIVILGFENMISMSNPFEFISVLIQYQIPVLYFDIGTEKISINVIKNLLDNYDDVINYVGKTDRSSIHIIHSEDFIPKIKEILHSNMNNYTLYIYYSNTKDLAKWMIEIDKYMKLYEFFYSVSEGGGMKLTTENNSLVVN